MIWSRPRRDKRRQKVLDELLSLDPQDRRERLDLAVAAGDVRPEEVEAALTLVSRLDAVRVMTLSAEDLQHYLPGCVRISGAPADGLRPANDRDARGLSKRAEPVSSEAPVGAAAAADGRPDAIAILPDPEVDMSWVGKGPLSMDAIEAAARAISRDLAARNGSRSARKAGTRKLRAVGPGERQPSPSEPTATDVTSEESSPSMSWLRP